MKKTILLLFISFLLCGFSFFENEIDSSSYENYEKSLSNMLVKTNATEKEKILFILDYNYTMFMQNHKNLSYGYDKDSRRPPEFISCFHEYKKKDFLDAYSIINTKIENEKKIKRQKKVLFEKYKELTDRIDVISNKRKDLLYESIKIKNEMKYINSILEGCDINILMNKKIYKNIEYIGKQFLGIDCLITNNTKQFFDQIKIFVFIYDKETGIMRNNISDRVHFENKILPGEQKKKTIFSYKDFNIKNDDKNIVSIFPVGFSLNKRDHVLSSMDTVIINDIFIKNRFKSYDDIRGFIAELNIRIGNIDREISALDEEKNKLSVEEDAAWKKWIEF